MDAYQDVCWNCRVRSVLDYLFNLRFNELIMNTVCQFVSLTLFKTCIVFFN